MEVNEGSKTRRPKHDNDVVALVKEYICSQALRQEPLLVSCAEDVGKYPLLTNRSLAHFQHIYVFYFSKFNGSSKFLDDHL